ncbi:LacI family DNA-binding transcriptional regulator [Aestuariibaculum suncheonense]|uniref:LacI family DNA-binding transcriptional regulator n=1 Tax=Aestuariibaculum suncheonense TaxID=1028745 RepID=A0A8J6Q5K4_9FLAO|nr:LacI family DNA-binding transcriptional regulator [Aestuariibaculum suncheonense]MBD0834446.1 LacI family DNA-binding transcriptional regulator [Aestuariibaculum suncheonense]
MKKHTIKDIAQLAGVSKGTVDRVIHKRGKVSEKALEKVNKVLAEIDYQPNLMARSLKNNKDYHLCALLPNPDIDPYWLPCKAGINQAFNEYKSLGITIDTHTFDPTSTEDFLEVNARVLSLNPDAVLMVPLFFNEATKSIKAYAEAEILVSIINNRIGSEDINNFVGQDLFQSGRIAARLMEMITPKDSEIIIAHLDEFFHNASFMQQKEKGFRDYFENLLTSNYTLKTCNSIESNKYKTLFDAIDSSKNISGIFVTTSKTYKVAKMVENFPNLSIKIIGYDLLEKNISYLNSGAIDFLIHQNPKQQIYLGLSQLAEYFLFDKPISEEKLLSIDIINSENYNSYLNQ